MKLLVAVKRVVDYNARIRVKTDQVCVSSQGISGRDIILVQLMQHLLVIWAVDQLHCALQTGVELANVKMSMNPFCEIAVEVYITCCHSVCL